MKIEFDDGSYVETQQSPTPNKMFIIVTAIGENGEKIINSAEVEINKIQELFVDFFKINSKIKRKKTLKKAVEKVKKSDLELGKEN